MKRPFFTLLSLSLRNSIIIAVQQYAATREGGAKLRPLSTPLPLHSISLPNLGSFSLGTIHSPHHFPSITAVVVAISSYGRRVTHSNSAMVIFFSPKIVMHFVELPSSSFSTTSSNFHPLLLPFPSPSLFIPLVFLSIHRFHMLSGSSLTVSYARALSLARLDERVYGFERVRSIRLDFRFWRAYSELCAGDGAA